MAAAEAVAVVWMSNVLMLSAARDPVEIALVEREAAEIVPDPVRLEKEMELNVAVVLGA